MLRYWTSLLILCMSYDARAGDGGWTEWSKWSSCSVTCGQGVKRRYRACENPPPSEGGKWCVGHLRESMVCDAGFECPVDGAWTEWTPWTACSTTCGQGIRRRSRSCTNPEPIFGGKRCEGSVQETEMCMNLKLCPRDGGWSPWSDWSPCSVTCSTGLSMKYRKCNNPPPAADGRPCVGNDVVSRDCSTTNECPVNGQWSEWSDWSFCSTTCGVGKRQRVRSCDNPPAQHGGAPCDTSEHGHIELVSCNSTLAHCPVDGAWSEWSDYGPCETLNCDEARTVAHAYRQRSCNNPLPEHGGMMCEGTFLDAGICMYPVNCKRDGGWGEWSDWICTEDLAKRVRTCDNPPPSNGGEPCPAEGSEEIRTLKDDEVGYTVACDGGLKEDEDVPIYDSDYGSREEASEDYYAAYDSDAL